MARTRTRRELLQDSALAAIAAGGIYGALEGLAAQPARAAVAATRVPAEQHLMRGIRLVVDEGQRVVVPPLHHEVVTARLRVRGRRGLLEARADARRGARAARAALCADARRASGSRSRGGCRTSANTCRACRTAAASPSTCPATFRRRVRWASPCRRCWTRSVSRATRKGCCSRTTTLRSCCAATSAHTSPRARARSSVRSTGRSR